MVALRCSDRVPMAAIGYQYSDKASDFHKMSAARIIRWFGFIRMTDSSVKEIDQ